REPEGAAEDDRGGFRQPLLCHDGRHRRRRGRMTGRGDSLMFRTAIAAALLAGLVALPGAAVAAEADAEVIDFDFSFEGPFGTFDSYQLQRGLQIYNNVCSGCHGLQFLSFQSLSDPTGPALP